MGTSTDRDRLLAELVRVLSLPAVERDRVVAAEESAELTSRLWEASAEPERDYDVLRTVGWVAWLRTGLLATDEENQASMDLSLSLLGPVWQVEPTDVPESFLAAMALEDVQPPQEPQDMARLGLERLAEFGADGQPENLDLAIFALRWAVLSTSGAEPGRPAWLSNLSAALLLRWDAAALLDEAVATAVESVQTAPDGFPDQGTLWSNLAESRMMRFESDGSAEDLDEAIAARRAAADHTAADDPARDDRLLAWLLAAQRRHDQSDDPVARDEFIESARLVAEQLPPRSPALGAVLDALANAHAAKFAATGVEQEITEAIRVGIRCLEATSADDPDRAASLANLAASYADRFDLIGRIEDADEAIRIASDAVSGQPRGTPSHAVALTTLGSALASRAEATGSNADLNAAGEHLQLALATANLPDHSAALAHSNLSLVERQHFDHIGDSAALSRSIEHGRAAVVLTPPPTPARARMLSNLAGKLRTRAERFRRLDDLNEAIELAAEAVEACPVGHASLPYLYNNLATALSARHVLTRNPLDLQGALDAHAKASELSPPGGTIAARVYGNRARTLVWAFEGSGDATALDQAIDGFRRATETAGSTDPERAAHLVGLAEALLRRDSTNAADRQAALAAFTDAGSGRSAHPLVRSRALRGSARLLGEAGEWAEAVSAYAAAIEMLQRVAPRWLGRSDQEHLLVRQSDLGTEAAAACLSAGDPVRAVELFEAGRAILYARALRSRPDLSVLEARRPDLLTRFSELNDVLGRVPQTMVEAERAADANAAFDDLVREIRTLDDFATFLGEPSADELLPAEGAGSLVALNVASDRGDAMVVTRAGISTVALPGLTRATASAHADTFLDALDTITDPRTDEATADLAEASLRDTLGWLWDVVMRPVLDELGLPGERASDQSWPRVHWCPSGALSILPLHAAGRFEGTQGNTVVDRVVSSTVPTLAALKETARPGPRQWSWLGLSTALVVAMPTTPGAADLPEAAGEAADLEHILTSHCHVLGLDGEPPTKLAVSMRLPMYRWAHFSCHAESRAWDPLGSRLLLADHAEDPFTIRDLMATQLDDATLAYLSACTTSRTSVDAPDEPVHLAAACQLAGYNHVIATLWPITDELGREVARDFYTRLTANGIDWSADGAALALHEAVRSMRDRFPDRPSMWAPHVHLGA